MPNNKHCNALRKAGRIYKHDKSGCSVEVEMKNFEKSINILKDMGIYRISNITGYDNRKSIEVIYTFILDNMPVNIKISLDRKKPEVNTITGRFPGAKLFERELAEMIGVEVIGNPDPHHLFLAGCSPKTPLRKD